MRIATTPPASHPHWELAGRHAHVVQFFEDDAVLVEAADGYLRRGFQPGGAAIVIATHARLEALEECWRTQGIDVEAARASGRLVTLDAAETLDRVCTDGRPSRTRFQAVIEPVIEAAERRAAQVVLFGEMVALLWDAGRQDAAVELEGLWNELARRHAFGLLCAYRFERSPEDGSEQLRAVCAAHDMAIPAESFTRLETATEQLVEICELQHKAQRLEQAVAAQLMVQETLEQREQEWKAVLSASDARQARRLDDFLGMLGHELRNPLAPIRHATEALRLTSRGNPDQERIFGMLDRQVRHMARLLDDLLDLSRITRGRIQFQLVPVDVADVVARAVESSRTAIDARGHALSVVVDAPSPRVLGDLERLSQALGHLLDNAAKYTPAGGRIALQAHSAGPWLELHVRDTGLGMDTELLQRAFQAFVQAERTLDRTPSGLGLGLALVRSIVEAHCGTVTVSSAGPGCGADFLVRLPLLEDVPGSEAGASGAQAGGAAVTAQGGLASPQQDRLA